MPRHHVIICRYAIAVDDMLYDILLLILNDADACPRATQHVNMY